MNQSKKDPYLIFIGMGFELVALILSSLWLGEKLDNYYKAHGVIAMGLMILSLVGWFVRLIYMVKKVFK